MKIQCRQYSKLPNSKLGIRFDTLEPASWSICALLCSNMTLSNWSANPSLILICDLNPKAFPGSSYIRCRNHYLSDLVVPTQGCRQTLIRKAHTKAYRDVPSLAINTCKLGHMSFIEHSGAKAKCVVFFNVTLRCLSSDDVFLPLVHDGLLYGERDSA